MKPNKPTARRIGPLPLLVVLMTTVAVVGMGADAQSAPRSVPAMPSDAGEIAAACGTTNPFFALAAMSRVNGAEDRSKVPAVLAVRDTAADDPAAHPTLITHDQVGDVYGLAYDAVAGHLYAAAYYRNGGTLGPGGLGQIYRLDVATGEVVPWVQLDSGSLPSGAEGEPPPEDSVGKVGLGDLDVAPDGSELFVVNLNDRRIYRLALPGGELLGSFSHGAMREPWRAYARPFGLGWHDGWLYHGVLNNRETGAAPLPFIARVYRSLPDGSDMEFVLTVGLPYSRSSDWAPWRPDSDGRSNDSPMIVDLAFRLSGAPIIGLRDRQADMQPDCVWDPSCAAGPSVGDLLPALPYESGGWTVVRDPPWYRDTGPDEIDLTWGALATIPGMDIVVSPSRSGAARAAAVANRLHAYWFDNEGGARLRGEPVLIAPDGAGDAVPSIDRLAAGDIEVLCAPGEEPDYRLAATATVEAGIAATATAQEIGRVRGTQRAARETAHVPTEVARATAAVGTATALAPTLVAAAPTRTAGAAVAAASSTAVVARLTARAPTAAAIATDRARPPRMSDARATDAASAYAAMEFTCGGHNPYMVTTCFVPDTDGQGRPYGRRWFDGQTVVVAFNDTAADDLTKHFSLAYQPEVGAVFGVAHDLDRDQVYVGAYVKRLADLGPLGTGGIYRIDLPTGAIQPFASLVAGVYPHQMSADFDKRAANAVGRVGLGDLEINDSFDELYAVNLLDKMIYRMSVPDGVVLGAFPHGAVAETWSGDAAPFALAYRDGWLYHAVTDTRAHDEDGERQLMAYVYRSRGDGTELSEVSRLDLSYARSQRWQPWAARHDDGNRRFEPMLVDIEFREDGDLVLGLRDRRGDVHILVAGSGDIVLTTKVGNRWYPFPAPELYRDNIRHDESSWGTLASLPWLDEVVSTVIDPINIHSGGAAWFENVSGTAQRLETIYRGRNVTFGKASGLGDVEALCAALTPTPSPTVTPTATSTPTASSTPTVTTTPTARSWIIYLPTTISIPCDPVSYYTDVVLVLDISTSMDRLTRAGRAKQLASLDQAKAFVAMMSFEPDAEGRHDQVAIVGFNRRAWIEQKLTNDEPAIVSAIDRLPAGRAEYTRLDLALERGAEALRADTRIPENTKVIILLTDGLPNQVPYAEDGTMETTVLRAATAAKVDGARIYTIAIGAPGDTNPDLLKMAATRPSLYYYEPDPEDLGRVYSEIVGTFGCPKSRYDWPGVWP